MSSPNIDNQVTAPPDEAGWQTLLADTHAAWLAGYEQGHAAGRRHERSLIDQEWAHTEAVRLTRRACAAFPDMEEDK